MLFNARNRSLPGCQVGNAVICQVQITKKFPTRYLLFICRCHRNCSSAQGRDDYCERNGLSSATSRTLKVLIIIIEINIIVYGIFLVRKSRKEKKNINKKIQVPYFRPKVRGLRDSWGEQAKHSSGKLEGEARR